MSTDPQTDLGWRWFRIPAAMVPLGFGFYRVTRSDGEGRVVFGYRRAERLMWRWSE